MVMNFIARLLVHSYLGYATGEATEHPDVR